MFATKMIQALSGTDYQERLQLLNLITLETRHTSGDLIEVFKMLKGFEDSDSKLLFQKSDLSLRDYELKTVKPRTRLDMRNYFSVTELLMNGINCPKK